MTFGWPHHLLVLVAIFAGAFWSPQRCEAKSGCTGNGSHRDISLWISPNTPAVGGPASIMATSSSADLPTGATLFVNGSPASQTEGTFWKSAFIAKAAKGSFLVELRAGKDVLACQEVTPKTKPSARGTSDRSVYWPTTQAWGAAFEGYYSAWIDRLFDAAPETSLGFRPLSQALQDPQRNLLWNHLGLAEDNGKSKSALRIEPDCADLPYMLRAYFSWKMGLPFGVHECDRGTPEHPPRCSTFHSNEEAAKSAEPLAAFKAFLVLLANKAHSGSLRTAMDDNNTDFYPIPLTRQALRPGTIFADPYGHVLVVARWIDRPGQPGLLFAVDGQPDKSITRKRFWEGNFLFASDVASAGAGFKSYRPLLSSTEAGAVTITNAENSSLKNSSPRSYDPSQGLMSPDVFYARLFKLINPTGLKAQTAYDDTLAALVEQLEARVRSVDNGEANTKQTHGALIDMPVGAAIFETVGAWEDYATPSRDMRLLIAMKVLLDLPVKLTSHPELFDLEGKPPAQVRQELEERHKRLTQENKINYTNSEGATVTLSVANVLERRLALQVAYNPNDCNELRWGAPKDSEEIKTCIRRAPAEQKARMEDLRTWFANMRRPTRN
jgi:hypothetical protein